MELEIGDEVVLTEEYMTWYMRDPSAVCFVRAGQVVKVESIDGKEIVLCSGIWKVHVSRKLSGRHIAKLTEV
jgi:hypothetical protein